MIPRYEMNEIANLWNDDHKFKTYLEVELAIMEAQEGRNIPIGTANQIRDKVKIRPDRINEIENIVQHDVIAFCTSITEQLDEKVGKFFHFGVTSSDIIDTAMNLTIQRSLKIILNKFDELLITLKEMAIRHKQTLTMGRSHGMFAEPLSLGGKWLGFYAELLRRREELHHFYQNECTAQFSGAVGNYTLITPFEEETAAKKLGLQVEKVSTQVIPRDHLAKLISIHALLASGIERMATEIRHLHRSEVAEVQEGFSKNQKGSSIMPHKKNPIAGENLTGISRIIRSHLSVALENIVLWHERDISHSSAERLYLPDNLGLTLYALNRLNKTLQRLEINVELIENRVFSHFSYLSSYFLHQILANNDVTREVAYAMIQQSVFKAKNLEEFFQLFRPELKHHNISDDFLKAPTKEEIKAIYLKHVETLFSRFN